MSEKPRLKTLTFTYEQSTDFTAKYADGATIKIMPSGNIYMGFFMDRPHEFENVIHEVSSEGNLGKEVSRTLKDGLCRQLQTAVVMNQASARAIAKLLLDTLDMIEKTQNVPGLLKKGDSHGK